MIAQICLCLSLKFYSRVEKSDPKFLSILKHISSFTFVIEGFHQEMHGVPGVSKTNEICYCVLHHRAGCDANGLNEQGRSAKQLNK